MQTALIVLIVIWLTNLVYYFGFSRFAFGKNGEQTPPRKDTPVSVIICAKNEAENLKQFLPAVLAQDHKNFEVIVINDASNDDTLEVIESFQKKNEKVKIVDVKNNEAFWGHKKYALTLGIKKAIFSFLLFTDADCKPESDQWISKMSAGFQDSASIVLGYGGYIAQKGSLLNKIIRFETLFTALQYFSYAKWGLPYMGVGRNLAYTSEEFYKQNGFASHLHLRSGDDDLFVNQAATKENTTFVASSHASTRSVPKKTFRDWFSQKKRHVSVAGNYQLKHRLLLGFFYLSQFFFWIFFLVLLFSSYWKIAISLYLFRLLVQGLVFYKTGKKFGEKGLLFVFPVLEPFLIFTQFAIFISNLISKPSHWK